MFHSVLLLLSLFVTLLLPGHEAGQSLNDILSYSDGKAYIEPGVWSVSKSAIQETVHLIGKPGSVIDLVDEEGDTKSASLLVFQGQNSIIENVRIQYRGQTRPKTLLRIDGDESGVVGCDITGNSPETPRTDERREPFGIWLNANGVSIVECAIRNCVQGVVSSSGTTGHQVIGSKIENLGEHGIYFGQGGDFEIERNAILGAKRHAIKTQISKSYDFDSVGIVIRENVCESVNNHAIVVTRTTDATYGVSKEVRIEDNDVTAPAGSGIVVIHSDGVSILRNTIHDAETGLDIRHSDHVDYAAQIYENVERDVKIITT